MADHLTIYTTRSKSSSGLRTTENKSVLEPGTDLQNFKSSVLNHLTTPSSSYFCYDSEFAEVFASGVVGIIRLQATSVLGKIVKNLGKKLFMPQESKS